MDSIQMRRESAKKKKKNKTPLATMLTAAQRETSAATWRCATSHQESLSSGNDSSSHLTGRPLKKRRHASREEERVEEERQAGDDDDCLPVLQSEDRRPRLRGTCGPMMTKCRRTSTLNLLILSTLFIIHSHQQTSTSEAQQTRMQNQQQQQHRADSSNRWQAASSNATIGRPVSSSSSVSGSVINQQAAGPTANANGQQEQQQDSSHKLSIVISNQNQANIITPRSQPTAAPPMPSSARAPQRENHNGNLNIEPRQQRPPVPPQPSDTLETAAATTSASRTTTAEGSESPSGSSQPSISESDGFESSGSESGGGSGETVLASDSSETGQPSSAAADGDEMEPDVGEEPTAEEGSPTADSPIDRSDDRMGEEAQQGSSFSTSSSSSAPDAYEGIQLRPSRQSQGGSQLDEPSQSAGGRAIGGGGATSTTLRTIARAPQETTTASTVTTTSMGPPSRQASSSPAPPPTQRPTQSASSPAAGSFDVSLGANRMLIKSADDYETRLLLSSSPSPLPTSHQQPQWNRHSMSTQPLPVTTTLSSIMDSARAKQQQQQPMTTRAPRPQLATNSNFHELATESVNHHYHELPADGTTGGHAPSYSSSSMGGFNGRRLESTGNSNNEPTQTMGSQSQSPSPSSSQSRQVGSNSQQQQQQFIVDSQANHHHELPIASICYTPFSLLMVILATIVITLIVCLSAYYLFKYLKRHQFDLVANSKHFDHKHLSSSSNGYSHGALGAREGAAVLPLSSQSANYLLASGSTLEFNHQAHNLTPAHRAGGGSCSVHHLLQANERCNKCLAMPGADFVGPDGSQQQALRRPIHHQTTMASFTNYAFRNPYFTDDELHQQRRPHDGSPVSLPLERSNSSRAGSFLPTTRLARTIDNGELEMGAQSDCTGTGTGGLLKAASSIEQMHFIESHIAELHNRQVTSSVKELSSLGADTMQTAQQVVDLTSEEQQARARAHSKEGDLVAIDLTGHDIIGLGFDVCGNQRDGIFIRSVSSHGPAKESGCMEPGDRIKCVNVSFENMTIQDACDILNAGAPYKLRLLIEKKIATISVLNKIQQSNNNRPTLLARGQAAGVGDQQQLRPMMTMLQPGPKQMLIDTHDQRGPLEMSRVYLRRLIGRVAAAAAGSQQEALANSSRSDNVQR
uniref:PDZ domain-containing protein n=1 Tax=Aceria tosichella TaxID=561515 RepID=A0A6G1S7T0_9ACAR